MWLQDRGVQLILDRLIGNTNYREINRHLEMGTLGSGEDMTLMSFELENNHKKQYVWMTYVLRGDRNEQIRDSIVFLFYNGDESRKIEKSLVFEITNYADKLFE